MVAQLCMLYKLHLNEAARKIIGALKCLSSLACGKKKIPYASQLWLNLLEKVLLLKYIII